MKTEYKIELNEQDIKKAIANYICIKCHHLSTEDSDLICKNVSFVSEPILGELDIKIKSTIKALAKFTKINK